MLQGRPDDLVVTFDTQRNMADADHGEQRAAGMSRHALGQFHAVRTAALAAPGRATHPLSTTTLTGNRDVTLVRAAA
ncbi:hypothetical protein CCO04_21450 [Pimelobacter sp. 30-1]|nr:hypothetical protein [Pimelobacter sp. 30-1]